MGTEVMEVEARLKDYISGNLEVISKKLDALGDAAETMGKRTESGAMSMMKGMLGAQAVIAGVQRVFEKVKQTAIECAQGFMEEEDAVARLGAMIKATGGALGITVEENIRLAKSLQETTRFADDATIAAEGVMTQFRGISGDVFPKAIKAAQDLASSMGGDLSSAAFMLGSALSNPTEGLTRLSRAGVRFTQEQRDRIEGFIKEGKLLDAQAIILKEIETRFGGVAEAMAKTDAGQLEMMKNQLGDIKEDLGVYIVPAMIEWNQLWLTMAQGALFFFKQMGPETKTQGERFLEIDLALKSMRQEFEIAPEHILAVEKAMDGLLGKEEGLSRGRRHSQAELAQAISVLETEREEIMKNIKAKGESIKIEESAAVARVKAAKEATDAYAQELTRSSISKDKKTDKMDASAMMGPSRKDIYKLMSDQIQDAHDLEAKNEKELLKQKESFADKLIQTQDQLYSFLGSGTDEYWIREKAKYTEQLKEKLITQEQYDKAITKLDKDQSQKRITQADLERQTKVSLALSLHGSMVQFMQMTAGKNREAFNIAKAAALATAGVTTAMATVEAYEKGLRSGVTWIDAQIYAVIAAAAAATAGGIQIASIASQKFATGTRRAPGGLSLVGEMGPELLELPQGSRVYSALETRNIINHTTSTNNTNNTNKANNTNNGNNTFNINVVDPVTGESLRTLLRSGELDNFVVDFKKRGRL